MNYQALAMMPGEVRKRQGVYAEVHSNGMLHKALAYGPKSKAVWMGRWDREGRSQLFFTFSPQGYLDGPCRLVKDGVTYQGVFDEGRPVKWVDDIEMDGVERRKILQAFVFYSGPGGTSIN